MKSVPTWTCREGRGFDSHTLHQPSRRAERRAKAATPEALRRRAAILHHLSLVGYGLACHPCAMHDYVYILVSEADPGRHYTGCTTDIVQHLQKHNEGGVPHTRKHRPWRVESTIRFLPKKRPVPLRNTSKPAPDANSRVVTSESLHWCPQAPSYCLRRKSRHRSGSL